MGAESDSVSVSLELLQPRGFLAGALYSALDTCRTVNGLARSRTGLRNDRPVRWQLIDANGRPRSAEIASYREGDADAGRPTTASAVFVPPLEMITLPQLQKSVAANTATIRRLQQAAACNEFICAVGTGVWLVAEAGLLVGRRAPVQWGYQSGFARFYPAVQVSGDGIVRAAERMLLASTPSFDYECVLELLAMTGLEGLSRAARDKLVFDPSRQLLAATLPLEKVSSVTRDSPLYRAVEWLTTHAETPLTIADAAHRAAVSERTLARLFRKHLGISPHDFLTDLRIKRGQMWLEVTLKSVEEIAHDCGYSDVSAFRRVFKRKSGMTPIEYRARYTQRAPRARWKLEQFGDDPQGTRS